MATEVIQPVSTKTLTADDRCDRCGAQAYVHVQLSSGGELLFCSHHSIEHADKIKELAVAVHDETHKLLARPTEVQEV